MNTAALRELIQQAHLSEARHGHLADLIASRLPRLHRTIQPQGENTEDILTRFVHAYVEQVPDLLDAANSVAREAGIEERIKPVLKVADRYIAHFGQALIPLDTTVANLVAHQLIGEPFANRLDEAVHHAVENMLDATTFDADSARAYRENLKNPRVVAAWQQWPCLSKQLGVELSLG